MKAAKTSKNLKEIPYPTQKKLLKRKWNNITPAKTNVKDQFFHKVFLKL